MTKVPLVVHVARIVVRPRRHRFAVSPRKLLLSSQGIAARTTGILLVVTHQIAHVIAPLRFQGHVLGHPVGAEIPRSACGGIPANKGIAFLLRAGRFSRQTVLSHELRGYRAAARRIEAHLEELQVVPRWLAVGVFEPRDRAVLGTRKIENVVGVDNHKPAEVWTQEEGKHYHVCENGCGTHLDEVPCTVCEATCVKPAMCEVCGHVHGGTNPSNHVNLVKVEAKPATHLAEGTIEHWRCDDCGTCFSDAAATTEIAPESTVIPKLAEHSPDERRILIRGAATRQWVAALAFMRAPESFSAE